MSKQQKKEYKMRTRYILIGLVAAGSMAMAGSVTIPNTFSANTTAKAAEVNANFTAVKNAVNDNAGKIGQNVNDIAANKNGIQGNANDIAANEAAIAGNIASVTAEGGLAGGGNSGDVTIKRASGYVSVNGMAFHPIKKDCIAKRDYSNAYQFFTFDKTSSSSSCVAYAYVALPDGATVTSFKCTVTKNDGDDDASNTHKKLKMILYQNMNAPSLPMANLSFDTSSPDKTSDETTQIDSGRAKVDNSMYSYLIKYYPPTNTNDAGGAGEKNMVYTCYIGYSF